MKSFVSLLLCLFCLYANAQQVNDPATLVQEWNAANNKQDIGTLTLLYDNDVLFYGTKLKKQIALPANFPSLKNTPDLPSRLQAR